MNVENTKAILQRIIDDKQDAISDVGANMDAAKKRYDSLKSTYDEQTDGLGRLIKELDYIKSLSDEK